MKQEAPDTRSHKKTPPFILGLTGSIGMGKSQTAALFRQLGVPVHCSDEAVHDLLNKKSIISKIRKDFADVWDKDLKSIDRKKLGQAVFNSASKRKKLEAILHPAVQRSQQKFITAQNKSGQKLVVLDIPLLFETGANTRCHAVLVVTAKAATQQKRVLARDGMTAQKFKAIKAAQMPDAQKRKKADFVISTDISVQETRKDIQKLLKAMRKEGLI